MRKLRVMAACAAVTTAVVAALTMASPAMARTEPAAEATAAQAPVLRVVSVTDSEINLAWTEDTRANGYFLFFDDNETPFIVGSDTEFTVEFNRAIGMIPGSTHTFQVETYDGGALSNVVTATFLPGDNEPPTAPTNLRVVRNDANGVVLAWDASIDESRISNYFVSGSPCSPVNVSGTSTTPAPTSVGISSIEIDPVCGITPGEYTFVVRARDEWSNNSPNSAPVTVTFRG